MMFGADSISYEQLDMKSTLLAKYLQRQGIGPNSLVAVYMERSLDLVVALLGTMKAGGAYIPLDPAYPKERLSYILEDSQARIVLTQSIFNEEVRDLCASQTRDSNANPARTFVLLDEHWSEIESVAKTNENVEQTLVCSTFSEEGYEKRASSADLAYVI